MQQELIYDKVSIPQGQIGYVKIGNGHPLVMITRYAATLYNWDRDLILGLARHFTLYLFDSREVGLSQSSNSDDINGYTADIAQAIDELNLEKPIILGWSFGGVAVQQLYKHYQHNISGLVFLSSFPDPRIASQEFIDLSTGIDRVLTDVDKLRLYQLMLSETPSTKYPNRMKHSTLNISNYHYRYTDKAKSLHNQFVQTSPASTIEELVAINVPSLILNARNDRSFPTSGREMLSNYIPNSKLIVYPTGGHLLIHHHGSEIASDIATFFIRSQLC